MYKKLLNEIKKEIKDNVLLKYSFIKDYHIIKIYSKLNNFL